MPRYAAIDIGSNSLRMLAADAEPGGPVQILASEREVTRLGESVFRTGRISEEAIKLACGVLARMAAQYRALDVVGVRAVATSSVRDARNQAEFVARASEAVQAPVEVISGREEARLIQLGVTTRWPHPGKRVLIVDIGGGSVEVIGVENDRMTDAVSKQLGAVRMREIFLRADPPSSRELHQMREYVAEKLADSVRRIGAGHWDRVIATSATASAVVCAVAGIPRSRRDEADRLRASTAQVRKLYRKLSGLDLAERRKVTGIGPRRAEIIVAGAGVLLAILEEFRQPSLNYSAAGVRDGIIADLAARGVGRELANLSREQRREVERMSVRYGVSAKHSRKVAGFAGVLFNALAPLHRLPPAYGKLLEAAAYLHDVGHYVNDASHHKHSYYLVANSDMSGFTARERELIANLCRYHRKAMPAPDHSNARPLGADERRAIVLLIPLLRVADSLDRSHEQRVESIRCRLDGGQVLLELASGADVDLETWAVERAAAVFRQVYNIPLVLGVRGDE
jgi:exopolyphosphatase/guanosine-5'-triphosphate,3'-diphosphate pyrophosphatase